MSTPLCLHCERGPACNSLGLCTRCHASRQIRRVYLRRRNWTPAWEAHLRRLTERARQGLPLFPDPQPAESTDETSSSSATGIVAEGGGTGAAG